jgi:hypothetical protein
VGQPHMSEDVVGPVIEKNCRENGPGFQLDSGPVQDWTRKALREIGVQFSDRQNVETKVVILKRNLKKKF